MSNLYPLLLLIIVLSCGKRVTEDTEAEARPELSNEGTYATLLIPVNGRISSQVHGEVRVQRFGDEFKVKVLLKDPPRGKLTQYLQTGSWCPKLDQDINGDGYLDRYETRVQAGPMIVPLDGDLSSQLAGNRLLLKGSFSYERSASYYLMLSDLHRPDDVVNDFIVKLGERDLPLERRTVLVYVTVTDLPASVAGQEVPIACGILTRISQSPSPDDSLDPEREEGPSRRKPPRRIPPRPDPPDPDPSPPDPRPGSWWERWRERWNRWRTGGRGGSI